jgi:hypothetical protein
VAGVIAVIWANTDAVRHFQAARALAFAANDIGMAFAFGAIATAAGAVLPLAAARLLQLGRFESLAEPRQRVRAPSTARRA